MRPEVRTLLDAGHVQPDPWSCGAQSVVMAAAVVGAPLPEDDEVASTVLDAHRRLTGTLAWDRRTRQLPWPRRLGTAPWAVARALSALTGTRHRVRWVPPWARADRYEELLRVTRDGRPAAIYVGSTTLPRHVVLAVRDSDGLAVHDPADGRLHPLTAADWCAGLIRQAASWPCPWLIVVPAR